jgi:hypothetical protein
MTWGKMQRKENGRRKNLSESRTEEGKHFQELNQRLDYYFQGWGD